MALFVLYRWQRENMAPRRKRWVETLRRGTRRGMALLREVGDRVARLTWDELTPRRICFRTVRAGMHTFVTASSLTTPSATRCLTLVIIATTLNGAMGQGLDREQPTEAWWTMPLGLRDLVGERGACSLPSMTLDYACFVESMWTAVEMGFVMRERANFVAEGLLRGYDLGVDIRALRGARIFEIEHPNVKVHS